ncbi:ABC transporter ATP-binding protein [Saccharopolyspora cebuensis]|uniref:ABC transporter ATP-binding protein n=1 Tax=Saccharopolyspora cebuensis TaxID=418759 RepID=UPI0031EBB81A
MTAYWRALGGRWRELAVLAGCSVLEAAPAFLSGALVQRAVDDGFAAGRLGTALAWLAAFGAAAVVGAFGTRLVWQRLGSIVEPLRDALVREVVAGVLHDRSGPRGGPDAAGVARVTQHVEVVRDATAGLLVRARGLVLTVLGALAGVAAVAGSLAWLIAPPVLLSLVVFGCLLPSLARRQRGLALADERTAAEAGAVLGGIRDVVACGAERESEAQIRDAIERQRRAAVRMSHATALRTLVISISGHLPVVLVLAAAPAALAGGMSPGAVLGALVYLTATVHPALDGLATTTSTVVLRLLVALRRLAEVRPPVARPGTAVPAGPVLTARGLAHRWGEHAEPLFQDLDLDLRPGEHLAVIGPSGIGKSTLAGVLAGTETPRAGAVLLGGVPIAEVAPAHRHRLIAFTPQETYLFAGTVRENLALLAPEAEDAHLLAAVAEVGAAGLVDRLGGLDGELGHGGSGHGGAGLSTGERQLLGVARVHASPAAVVILDEATAHLDGPAEARAERALARPDRALVVIAHRPASARRAKRILVLDGARCDLGEHEALLHRSERYAELARAWELPATAP